MSQGICAIVGAGPSLGMAIARRFGREGFSVALLARKPEHLAEYVGLLKQEGIDSHGFVADAGDSAALQQAFDRIRDRLGPADVLIYNAVVARSIQPAELDIETLVADFRVNVAGALASAQQVLPDMRAGGRGTIIFTGGGLALNPLAQYASLSVDKAALRNLTFTLSEELEAEGIHVATVTIAGFVRAGTHFDPDLIAEYYWQLHTQPAVSWEREKIYR